MSDGQLERDHKISRRKTAKKTAQKSNLFSGMGEKFRVGAEVAVEYAETTLIVLYIVNGLAAAAILFEIVEAPQKLKFAVAAFALAYSAIGFLMFIHKGVKHQIAERKARGE